MPYKFVPTVFTHVLRLRRYERKYIDNRQFRTNAVTLIQNFRYKGSPLPINHFCTISQPNECLTTLPLAVFAQKKTLQQTFFKRSPIFTQIGRLAFFRPPLGNLGATYDNHLRLIGKRVVDFLLALIELFSLGVTAEELRAIIGSKWAILLQRGPVDPKFQVEGVALHQPFFSENQAKCSFIWYINMDRSLYRFVTIHACNGQTDGQTDGKNSDRQTAFAFHAAR